MSPISNGFGGTLFIFLPVSPRGLTGGAAGAGNAGLRAALTAGLREQRLLGRPSALHVGGRWSAGLGRAGSPHTRTAAARRGSRRPGEGGASRDSKDTDRSSGGGGGAGGSSSYFCPFFTPLG